MDRHLKEGVAEGTAMGKQTWTGVVLSEEMGRRERGTVEEDFEEGDRQLNVTKNEAPEP